MIKISEYVKNILTMMTGAFISQLILIAGSLVITRIYTPEDLGIIALFLSIANILTVISTVQYQHAVILPKNNNDAYNLAFYTCVIVIVFCVILTIIIYPLIEKISIFFGQNEFELWLYWLPPMIILNAFFYIFRSWLIRVKNFKQITSATIFKSLILNLVIISGGIYSKDPIYFLIGNLLAQLFETFFLFSKIKREKIISNTKVVNKILSRYSNFPKYQLPSALVNNYTSQNPIILLNFFFGTSTIGYFALTRRVLALPIKLIANTTKEVYKQKATEEFNRFGNCKKSFNQTFKLLFISSFVPLIILFFLSPFIFSFLFGPEWEKSGIYARYLLIMFCLQFSVSPLSYTLFIRDRQKYDLYWQIGLLVLTTTGILIGAYYNSADIAIICFSVAYSLMYLIYLKLIYDASR